mmetsp:Transcript_8726/g.23576  ORF Transcript_8726/g.23576 Transcript_8726/m.23576 type:complete len:198 (-) Transcript_8726:380-973(-)|eukprot:CAMPEP_0113872774 /NCGR_PEP_ID=MMETSP0780_2-20120614/3402_1 /TAXON_ID=652834 /ORGANISM="Palpitomonas bilix" /LENGTH=197 /DNA_ID=CAMNT_0000858347 /DNA_START=616 /DNA_END=1209 /DNA_ORIENTATION=+ /assembly_acc=CAM_ASM_000599
MPHINLLYPFVSPDQLEDAAHAIAKEVASCPAFDVQLARVGYFKHGRGRRVCWLEPTSLPLPAPSEAKDGMQLVYEKLRGLFESKQKKLKKLTPHLTCGHVVGDESADEFVAEHSKEFNGVNNEPSTFSVASLCILKRERKDDPFSVVYRIPLSISHKHSIGEGEHSGKEGVASSMVEGVAEKVFEPYSHEDWLPEK